MTEPTGADLRKTAVHEAGHAIVAWAVWRATRPGVPAPWTAASVFSEPQVLDSGPIHGVVELNALLLEMLARGTGPLGSRSPSGSVLVAAIYAGGVVGALLDEGKDPSSILTTLQEVFAGGGVSDFDQIVAVAKAAGVEPKVMIDEAVSRAASILVTHRAIWLSLSETLLTPLGTSISWAQAVALWPALRHPSGPCVVYWDRTTWTLDPTGSYVRADDPIARIKEWHPHLRLVDSKGRLWPAGEVRRAYGRPVERVCYDLVGGRTGYHIVGAHGRADLYLRAATLAETEARKDTEIADWLALLCGEQHDSVLDWLATCHDLAHPTSVAYFRGAKGAGKQLFSAGVASLWGASPAAYHDIVGTTFNAALRDCPVVVLDESAKGVATKAASWMSLMANTQHALSEKFVTTTTLLGCPRLIVTSNRWTALQLPPDNTEETADAIGERILAVEIPGRLVRGQPVALAAEHLGKLGGWAATSDWVGRGGAPGRFAAHVAWLRETRIVIRGARWLVPGDADRWRVLTATREDGVGDHVLAVLTAMLFDDEPANAVLKHDRKADRVLVSPSRLHDRWLASVGGRKPSQKAIGVALRVLSGADPGERPGRVFDTPAWRIPIVLIAQMAVAQHRVAAGVDAAQVVRERIAVGLVKSRTERPAR